VVAQCTVVPAAALGTVKPFLPLLAVVAWGLVRGPLAAGWWAVAVGLMLDVVSPSPFLFYTIPMLLVVGVTALSRGRLFQSNLLPPWLVAGLATLVFWLVQRALLPLTGAAISWRPEAMVRELLPEAAVNLIWFPMVYLPLRLASRRASGQRMEWER
jgi:rod shape-determining protein MreD